MKHLYITLLLFSLFGYIVTAHAQNQFSYTNAATGLQFIGTENIPIDTEAALWVVKLKEGETDPSLIKSSNEGITWIALFGEHQWLIRKEGMSPWPANIISVARYDWTNKVSSSLFKQLNTQASCSAVIRLDKKWMRNNQFRNFLSEMGVKVNNEEHIQQSLLTISGLSEKVKALLQKPYVLNGDLPAQNIPLAREVKANNGSFYLQHSPLYANLLQGDSVVLGIGDSYTSLGHTDLKDRSFNFNHLPLHLHGILTAGVMGGAGNIDPKARGVAPHSLIINQAFNRIWAEAPNYFADYGMTLTNNSYAAMVGNCTTAGTYDVYAQALDEMANEYPDLLHVFAAGNDGNLVCTGMTPGFGNITGGYQVAKNTLAVGMTYKWLNLHNSSSRGPVKDGRLKPELVSIGGQVFGPSINEGYIQTSGTSLSCPSVVGGLALMTQRFRHLHSGANPKTDVMKAILLATTSDLGRRGPDYWYGYGMMNLRRALQCIEQQQFFRDSLIQSGVKNFSINVPSGVARLKVLLYYNDVAANPSSSKQLVNDLNMTVSTPSASVHTPLVLKNLPGNLADTAIQGIDTLNNSEMVVIDNPTAGSYSISVSGSSLSTPQQTFAVAYDIEMEGLQFLYPTYQTASPGNDSLRIYWEASAHHNTLTLEFSDNNGISWSNISNNISATAQSYSWMPPALNTAQCRLRLSRNGTSQTTTSEPFVINTQPIISLSAAQCPGFIQVEWTPIPNATSYEIWIKKSNELEWTQSVSAPNTSAIIEALNPAKNYWVAVYPMFGTSRGYRSISIERTPNNGNCLGAFADGDLSVRQYLSPAHGRLNTSTALSNNQQIIVLLGNNDDVPASNYSVLYSINNGPWSSLPSAGIIPAAGTLAYTIPNLDLSMAGDYNLRVVVNNLSIADPVHSNDTLRYTLRQLPNNLVNLLSSNYAENFESNDRLTLLFDTIGWDATSRWDFMRSGDTGRLQTFASSVNVINGDQSLSLDSRMNNNGTANFSTMTLNLGNLNVNAHEVRLGFLYRIHGKPKTADSNTVWVRGNDTDNWKVLYRYDTSKNQGTIENSGSLSLTQVLQSPPAQQFSSSTQIRFGQNDTSTISGIAIGNGITLDDIDLYLVSNDLHLSRLLSPLPKLCGVQSQVPLTIRIVNTAQSSISGAVATYRINGGMPISETLPSIPAQDSIDYTFTSLLNMSVSGNYDLDVWIDGPLDSYPLNDSLMNINIRVQPLITSFPYLENFEISSGNFYAEGVNNSWALGTPSGTKIKKAASGNNAWKTGLSGAHNDLETSYLYSPCFDVTALSSPMLSFSHIVDVEDCGSTLCDQSYMEYSTDGVSWQRIGLAGQGTNWYNNATHQSWIDQNNTRWRVASISLPSSSTLQLRWVMKSDAGASMEGIGIDDVHIYDFTLPIYNGTNTGSLNSTASNTTFQHVQHSGGLVSSYRSSIGTYQIETEQYAHSSLVNPSQSQYFFPRSYVVQSSTTLTDSIIARFYLLDQDFLTMLNASLCSSCTKPEDIYSLGISKFSGSQANENGVLTDNHNGITTFIPSTLVKWVPYDNGYYAEVKVGSLSEFWFNDGGPSHSIPLPLEYVSFEAHLINENVVQCTWHSVIDTDVQYYEVEVSPNATIYNSVDTVISQKLAQADYFLNHQPDFNLSEDWYYRLRWTMNNGKDYYSPAIKVSKLSAGGDVIIFPNPVDQNQLNIQWAKTQPAEQSFKIVDVMGRIVLEKSFQMQQAIHKENISTIGWARGIYFVHATSNGNTIVKKIILK